MIQKLGGGRVIDHGPGAALAPRARLRTGQNVASESGVQHKHAYRGNRCRCGQPKEVRDA